MLNILVPLGGTSAFFDSPEYLFPKPLVEIQGKPMIEMVINNLELIRLEKKYVFVVKSSDCHKYHLNNVLQLITNNQCEIVKLENETKGATCSALLAVDYIDSDDELLIVNGDQIIDYNLTKVITSFRQQGVDAGVICFESVHPRWSFIRLDEQEYIVEAAEKEPISKSAIAGFYYFKQGSLFVHAAMKSIEKNASINGLYFIAPVLNELILENKVLKPYYIDKRKYHSFYSPQKIKEYEMKLFDNDLSDG